MGIGPTILHADLDAFYASVEQLLNPVLRGRPIAVGGSPTGGVVLAASYEAKAFGVSGGMPGWRAARLCPDLVFVGGHFARYAPIADQVMDVLADVTPLIERISIDEAFCDISGATHLFGDAATIAALIRRRVREEIGLPISVGAARTKHLAKIASQVAKPDGVVVVPLGGERAFLDPLPSTWSGESAPSRREQLASRGIRTIGDLAATPSPAVESSSGMPWVTSCTRWRATTTSAASPARVARTRSGAQSALGRRPATPSWSARRWPTSPTGCRRRMREGGRAGRTVTVRVRFTQMRSVTRSLTLPQPVATHADPHRGRRTPGLARDRREPHGRRTGDHPAGDLGVPARRPAPAPARAGPRPARPLASRLSDRARPGGRSTRRWTRSAAASAATPSATHPPS